MFDRLREDVQSVRDRDPAARSFLEILLLYPGLRAIRMHRRAYWCYHHNLHFLARWISQRAARRTGIERKDVGKRHPTIGNGVMIGAGAKVLGPFTVGDNSQIAAGAVVLTEIPPNCTAVGVPAQVIKENGQRIPLDQIHIPNPVQQHIDALDVRIRELEEKLKKAEAQ